MKTTVKAHLLRSTLLAALSVASGTIGSAYAQQTVPTATDGPAADDKGDVVVVTGSRIARQDFTAVSPVTTVGAEDVELTATLSVEQLLNELPQIIPGNTITSNNAGGEDFATIDLRGLGPARTLVLVDGERVPAASTTGVVDLNTIPAGLIERIEVVTGGASAVYGSDAIAGVVNFILKQDYEGAEIRSTVSSSEDGLGKELNMDFLVGGNFDNGKGNLATYGSYYTREGVFQSEFDYSRVSQALVYGYDNATSTYTGVIAADSLADYLAARAELIARGTPGSTIAGTFAGGGSGTPPWGSISSNAANPFQNLSTLLPGQFAAANTDCDPATAGVAVNGGGLSFNDSGALTPFFGSRGCIVPIRANGSSRYNFAPDNYLQIPGERWGLQTFGHYDISDSVDLKLMLSYVNSAATVQLAPTPITGLSIPVSSPAIAGADGIVGTLDDPHPDLSTALNSRPTPGSNFTYAWRSVPLGGRVGEFNNHSLTTRATLHGDLAPGWEWNFTAGYGRVGFDSTLKNNVNSVALLQGVTGCANIAVGARLKNCVNVDIFGPNALTAPMANFIATDVTTTSTFEQSAFSGFVRGDLFQLPAGPVAAVFGVEYREDNGTLHVDDAQRRGEIAGFNAQQSVKGAIDVAEAYTEVSVPILSKMPLAYDLTLEAGYRTSDYSTVGSVSSYKYGGNYAPFQWLNFRSVYNKAVRAPSLIEINQAGDQGFPSYVEPCRSSAAPALSALRAFCITQGVPASAYVGSFVATNAQVQAFAFGNPNLSPETAETITAGVVFQPDFLPIGDLNLSVDYYDITLQKAIVSRGAQTILNSCYSNLGATPQSASDCAQVVRDPATGQITSVNTSLINGIADLQTKGVDIQGDFTFDLDELFASMPGRLNINVLASIVDSYDNFGTEVSGTTEAGIGGAVPDWKTVTTVRYDIGDWLFQVRHAYVPGLKQDYPGGTFGGLNVPDTPEVSNIDLSVRWNVSDAWQLTAVVKNALGDLPPQTVTGTFDQANTDAALYAPFVLGRSYSISARMRF